MITENCIHKLVLDILSDFRSLGREQFKRIITVEKMSEYHVHHNYTFGVESDYLNARFCCSSKETVEIFSSDER